MSFAVQVNGKNYNYDLGASQAAQSACYGLACYKNNRSNYDNVRRIFADLSYIVREGNPINRAACLATQAFALLVFVDLNDYQKFFVANSVTSIYAWANLSPPEEWKAVEALFGSIVQKSIDTEAKLKAGIAMINTDTGQAMFAPIPKYSA